MKKNEVNHKMLLFFRVLRYIRRKAWTISMAYMVGIHNFYKEEDKTPDNIVLTIEDSEWQEDNAPKD